jgi:S-adenosylmethionine uptake transporter
MSGAAKSGAQGKMDTGSVLQGAFWMLLAALCFAAMNGAIRHLSTEFHPFALAFFRNFFGLAFMLPWILRHRGAGLKTDRMGLHFIRALIGMTAMLAWFWALVHMPMAEAVALNFTMPLFTTLLAIPLLGEVVRLRRWAATIVGFLGVLVIIRPGAGVISDTTFIVLFASVFMAGAGIAIKMLSRTESNNAIVAYMVLFMTPMSLVPALFVWTTPTWAALPWLIALGGFATLAHQCLTRSFRAAEASAVMPFDYARLPFTALVGYLAFGQVVDIWTWVGGGIIAAAGLYIAHREVVLGRARTVALAAGDRAGGAAYRDDDGGR